MKKHNTMLVCLITICCFVVGCQRFFSAKKRNQDSQVKLSSCQLEKQYEEKWSKLVNQQCLDCHQDHDKPFHHTLASLETIKPYASIIKGTIDDRSMPPRKSQEYIKWESQKDSRPEQELAAFSTWLGQLAAEPTDCALAH